MLNLQFKQRFCYFALIMKCPFCISLLLGCVIGFAACTGPVIIVESEDDTTQTEQNDSISTNKPDSGTSSSEQNDTTSTNNPPTQDTTTIIHEGTYVSPYSIAEAQAIGSEEEAWIEGYIVGSVKNSMKSGCNYSSETTIASNILLADTFPKGSEEDYLYCMPIELPNGSVERDELNLCDNPDNYHRKVRILGNITRYFSVAGIKDIADYIFCDEEDYEDVFDDEIFDDEIFDDDEDEDIFDEDEDIPEDNEEPSTPDTPTDSDATSTDTLTVAEGIVLQNKNDYIQATIKGYIVGYSKGNNNVTFPDAAAISNDKVTKNVVIADDINEREKTKVIVVELPEGVIREEVNLYKNPDNLHKQLTVRGRMIPYYGLAGCRETLGTENHHHFMLE